MKEISLTKGKVALVNSRDYRWLSRHKWYALQMKPGYFQAVRAVRREGWRESIYMHREILGLKTGDKRQGDHKNGNSLDNRRRNLRIASSSQNGMNRGKQLNNHSGFKGVSWHAQIGRWRAQIVVAGSYHSLGTYPCPIEAHAAYCAAAQKLHRAFARTQ